LGCDVIHSGRKDTLAGQRFPDYIMAVRCLYRVEGCAGIIRTEVYRNFRICVNLVDIRHPAQYNNDQNNVCANQRTMINQRRVLMDALHERIARKAFELYEQRGFQHGHDTEDWLEAERLIFREMKSQLSNITTTARRKRSSPEPNSLQSV
jgi:hypothetical protein